MSKGELIFWAILLGVAVGLLIARLIWRAWMRWPGDHS